MNAREVIAERLLVSVADPVGMASDIVYKLHAAGFTIMSKEDVEAVRDKALEEAADIGRSILLPVGEWGDRKEAETFNAAVHQYELEIRSLKSGGRDEG